MFEIGYKLPVEKSVCTSEEECRSKDPKIVPGYVYEVNAVIEPGTPFTPSDIPSKVYALIMKTRQEYPGIIINYISISDDGSNLVMQVSDQGWVSLIPYIIMAIIIFVGTYYVLKELNILLGTLKSTLPPPSGPTSPTWWMLLGIGIAVPAIAIGYLVKSIRGK